MQFWCSAGNTAWTWNWRAYPGVWLFIVLLWLAIRYWNRAAAGNRRGIGTAGPKTVMDTPGPSATVLPGGGPPVTPGGNASDSERRAPDSRSHAASPAPSPAPSPSAFPSPRTTHPLSLLGLFLLWLALDWPLGALGAGYLASVHMLQFILIALIAPPLLLQGPSPDAFAFVDSPSRTARALRRLTAPTLALILFNATVLLTHLPPIVDALMVTQLGSLAIDLAWLAGGLLFWWPLVVATPSRPAFVPPLRMLYVIIGLMFSPVMFGLVGFLVYSERPLYGIYELAPPLPSVSSHADHQLAGVLMSICGALIAFIAISIVFFRWSRTDA